MHIRVFSGLAFLAPILLIACGEGSESTATDETTAVSNEESTASDASTHSEGSTSADDDLGGDGDGDGDTESAGDGDGDTESAGDGDGDGEPSDYGNPGPGTFSTSELSATLPNGCELDYEVLTPEKLSTDVVVVLAHGFQRSVEAMGPMAEHFASWGMTVVNAPLCSNSFTGVDHARNGEALAQLAAIEAPQGALFGI